MKRIGITFPKTAPVSEAPEKASPVPAKAVKSAKKTKTKK